jgi:hypothetical protein
MAFHTQQLFCAFLSSMVVVVAIVSHCVISVHFLSPLIGLSSPFTFLHKGLHKIMNKNHPYYGYAAVIPALVKSVSRLLHV